MDLFDKLLKECPDISLLQNIGITPEDIEHILRYPNPPSFKFPEYDGLGFDIYKIAQDKLDREKENLKKDIKNKKPIKINLKESKNMDGKVTTTAKTTDTATTMKDTSTTDSKRIPINQLPTSNNLFNSPQTTTTSVPNLTDVDVDHITCDINTENLIKKLVDCNTYQNQRVNIESTLNADELNDKVNYILQYFFTTFGGMLENSMYDHSVTEIKITLEVPSYTESKAHTYTVVMNQVAHKKAVKMITDILNSKGYTNFKLTHSTSKNKIVYFEDNSVNIKEVYTFAITI